MIFRPTLDGSTSDNTLMKVDGRPSRALQHSLCHLIKEGRLNAINILNPVHDTIGDAHKRDSTFATKFVQGVAMTAKSLRETFFSEI
ncbi:hypothetical protein GCM10023195_01710 [Actinoallomurus liliacearum]|uniref:Uncharacterized protein n=1 Tax=Actinoallomurus liliacearum TaxID=1080073 RepID=A0ABP8TB43_9ACTN